MKNAKEVLGMKIMYCLLKLCIVIFEFSYLVKCPKRIWGRKVLGYFEIRDDVPLRRIVSY